MTHGVSILLGAFYLISSGFDSFFLSFSYNYIDSFYFLTKYDIV